jgi:hypothetical protein
MENTIEKVKEFLYSQPEYKEIPCTDPNSIFYHVAPLKFMQLMMRYANSVIFNNDDVKDKNVEKFLIDNGFSLETYYETNKRYVKRINESQNLYVRIFSDKNEIVEVEYEQVGGAIYVDYDASSVISLDTIQTLGELEYLVKAIWGVPSQGYVIMDANGEVISQKDIQKIMDECHRRELVYIDQKYKELHKK